MSHRLSFLTTFLVGQHVFFSVACPPIVYSAPVGGNSYCGLFLHMQIEALKSASVHIADSPADMGVTMRHAMEKAGKL